MARLLLRLILALTLLFVLALSIVQTLVWQGDRGLAPVRAALFTVDCKPPCFLGIRPFATGVNEAVQMLRKHPWVNLPANTPPVISDTWSGVIVWSWNGNQPPWISSLSSGSVRLRNGIVELIEIPTMLTYSDIWLLFGHPDEGALNPRRSVASHPSLFHYVFYRVDTLGVRLETDCPLRPVALWDAKVTLLLGITIGVQLEPYDLRSWYLETPRCRR